VLSEFLRELVTAVFRAVLVVLFDVDLVRLVKDFLNLVFDGVTGGICVERGVALDAGPSRATSPRSASPAS